MPTPRAHYLGLFGAFFLIAIATTAAAVVVAAAVVAAAVVAAVVVVAAAVVVAAEAPLSLIARKNFLLFSSFVSIHFCRCPIYLFTKLCWEHGLLTKLKSWSESCNVLTFKHQVTTALTLG